MGYLPLDDADRSAMLEVVGASSVDDLFSSVPAALLGPDLSLPAPLGEQELVEEMTRLAARNRPLGELDAFLGAGVYRRFIPAIVRATVARPEFYTAYTPYQAEASQGTLQTIFEWQSMICALTGLDVANASMYDGATSAAEALLMAVAHTRRTRVAVSAGIPPEVSRVIDTYARARGVAVDRIELDGGLTPAAAVAERLTEDHAALLVAQPTFLGTLESLGELADAAHAAGALAIAHVDPIACAALLAPGEAGFDIAVGDGQPLGIPPSFGGPHVGFMASRQALVRRLPGRLVGMTLDHAGRRAYTLTLQTREQHIRREQATSNICTNHALMALAATVYMAHMGAAGMRAVAEVSARRAHHLAAGLARIDGAELAHPDAPFLWEFALRVPGDAAALAARMRDLGIVAGLPLGGDRPLPRDRGEPDPRARGGAGRVSGGNGHGRPHPPSRPEPGWAGPDPVVFELGGDLDAHPQVPDAGVPAPPLEELLPAGLLRRSAPALPAVAEPVLARHLGRLARRNHNLHQGMYPLGSCTMKYNPIVDEQLAGLAGFADLHPYQDAADVQGTLELMWELERLLAAITGMARMSLQPAAGAHGEWTGLRMIQAYHAARGDAGRTRVLVPDSAHGTNPASAGMAGLEVVSLRSTAAGTVDVDDLRRHLDGTVAAVMMTNPNTLGVFETEILEIAEAAHAAGALLYYDGANLNALVGIARPGDMGFDVVHLNLHKTFSTPHGGGGPGAGPVGVAAPLVDFLPSPTVERDGDRFLLDDDRPRSIGKVRAFHGNVGMLVRAYAYIRAYGDTLPQIARDAVLNARYLQVRLRGLFGMAVDAPCMHEFVATTRGGRVEGLKAMDVAKRMIDHGVYPPTVYFPTTVPEAMMFEPTETESRRSLDGLADILAAIVAEAENDLAFVQASPHCAPVERVDEVMAARRPVLRWAPDRGESPSVLRGSADGKQPA